MADAYPLEWPAGWPRTPAGRRQRSQFGKPPGSGVPGGKARSFLQNELKLLGARSVVLSTNLALRLDGLPYASEETRRLEDPGRRRLLHAEGPAAVHPPATVGRRSGTTSTPSACASPRCAAWIAGAPAGMVEAAFAGFKALPSVGSGRAWWNVLEVSHDAPLAVIEEQYRKLAVHLHPDKNGGNAERFIELQEARRQAQDARRQEVT